MRAPMTRPLLLASSAFCAAAAIGSGCFAPQPAPPCQVVSTQGFNGNPPYLALLTSTSATGACTEAQRLRVMRVGAQSYVPPGTGAGALALRPGRLSDLVSGVVFKADVDAGNNCQAGFEGKASPGCATCSASGANPCRVVEDPIVRVDPSDPERLKLNAVGAFPREPTDGRCGVSAPMLAEQALPALTVDVIDGGPTTFPALRAAFEFSQVQVLATAEVPGTAFTATLTQTEGACVASYDVVAFYPAVACTRDVDCAPVADLDAGHPKGSGIDPAFAPTCDTALGVCVPGVDVTRPGLPKR